MENFSSVCLLFASDKTSIKMLEALELADQQLVVFLNGLNAPWLDPIMAWITGKKEWFPCYALLIGWIFWKYKWKQGLLILVFIAITIALADRFASGFCKPFFERLRPCHEPSLATVVHIVNGKCGGKFGFISSHAANTFGVAMFFFLLGRKDAKWLRWLFLWAAVVSYSRVYVGVHYPADILVGGLTGILWGWLSFRGYRWCWGKLGW